MNDRTASTICPEYHYRDAGAALAFLEHAFGFVPQRVVRDGARTVVHAQLGVGNDCLSIGALEPQDASSLRNPLDVGGRTTGSAYIGLSDVEALYERVKAARACIVHELAPTDYGSLDFSARDPEGFLWQFGTYRPCVAGEAESSTPKLYAAQRYERARDAIAFLCAAFGFAEHFVVPEAGDPQGIAHAQLTLGSGIFMLGSAHRDDFNTATPRELEGGLTQSLYVHVTDPDAHYLQARSAGADIVAEPGVTARGARGYTARDCEGYLWTFSTYVPAPAAKVG